jgi:hypothetical protein
VVRIPVTESPSLEARSLTIFSPATTTYLRFSAPSRAFISRNDFAVNMARSAMARKMRKIHVAAYVPAEFGVHDVEYRDVLVDVKKAMVIPVCEFVVEPMAMPSIPSMCSSPWATIVKLKFAISWCKLDQIMPVTIADYGSGVIDLRWWVCEFQTASQRATGARPLIQPRRRARRV